MGVEHHHMQGVQHTLLVGSLNPPVRSQRYGLLLKVIPRRFTTTCPVTARVPWSWNFVDLVF